MESMADKGEAERAAVRDALRLLAERLREKNAAFRQREKSLNPVVLFHSGAAWDSDDIGGAFW